MASNPGLDCGRLSILLTFLSVYVFQADGNLLQESAGHQDSGCPSGWLHYARFCLARGEGPTDRAVALYCDGFGGIGIKGLCIIRAQKSTLSDQSGLSEHDPRIPSQLALALQATMGLGKDAGADESSSTSAVESQDVSILNSSVHSKIENSADELCSPGWIHYRSMCVYKPWTVQERCHLMNSVEFNGLCLKHAGSPAQPPGTKDVYREGKRICCCANVRAKGNRYGC